MSEVKDQLATIERSLAIARGKEEKLSKGVKSSAPKLRAALLDIGKECSQSRKSVLDIAKSIPVKTKAPKEPKLEESLPGSPPALERQDGETPSKKPRGRRPKLAAVPAVIPEAD